MSQPFIAEIRMFGFNYAPRGWAFCNGQLLPISQNTALFSLVGTTYGGNGQSNFALPNLQGRTPIQQGNGPGLTPRVLGEASGVPTVTLLTTEMPAHTHTANAQSGSVNQPSPAGNTWGVTGGRSGALNTYAPTPNATMSPQALGISGGSQPHENMPPYLTVNFCIALEGVFPARN